MHTDVNLNPALAGKASSNDDRMTSLASRPVTIKRTTQRETAQVKTESLDYHDIRNMAETKRSAPRWVTKRSIFGVAPITLVKLLVTIAIGMTTGVLAVGLALGTENIIVWKNILTRKIIHDGHKFGVLRAALFHIAFSVVLTGIGSISVQFLAPQAGGAGVSLIIAYLNGCAISRLLDYKTLIVKWIGTILAVGSNLALGPEAPMVHLGASVAHVYTHCTCLAFGRWRKLQRWVLCCFSRLEEEDDHCDADEPLTVLYSDTQRREFICAGASAGIAAAFGAPIGGVLFSMEEAATHWSRKVAWRCFLCTAVAVYTLAQLHPRWKHGILSFHGVAEMENKEWFFQLPFVFLISSGGGLLGALFNWLHEKIFAIRAKRDRHLLRIAEVAGIATFTVGAMFFLAYWLGTCIEVPDWQEKGYGFTFHCKTGTFNDLATAFLSNPDATIRHLFSFGKLTGKNDLCSGSQNCYFTLKALIVLCPSYLLFMSLAAGIAIPGGLFMPSMLVGGSFGGICGLLLMKGLPNWNIQPGVYAMCAATAMLGGVFRASISLVVLLVEGTQSTKFMLGIIIAVICSNWVGDWIHREGVYETDLERDGSVVFLRPSPPAELFKKTAGDLMASPVWCFNEIESLEKVMAALGETTHNGFPVIRSRKPVSAQSSRRRFVNFQDEAVMGSGGILVGTILRSQLVVMVENKALCNAAGESFQSESEDQYDRRVYDLDRKMRLFYRSHEKQSHMRESVLHAHAVPHDAIRDSRIEDAPEAIVEREADAMENASQQSSGSLFVDLRPFMDIAPISVRDDAPAERAHVIFLSLGLRHLPVVEDDGTVCGIITRKDLDNAAEVGPWRRNKQASKAYSVNSAVSLARGLMSSFSTSLTFSRRPSGEEALLPSPDAVRRHLSRDIPNGSPSRE